METENKTPLSRMQFVDKTLDEYEAKIGLCKYQEKNESEAERYLSMSRGQIEKLDIEGCAQAALTLSSFSFYIQRSYNREIARVKWADSLLKKIVAGRENQYSGSWESQYYQAVKNDDYTMGVYKIQQYAQQRAERLTYLATSIKSMADMFINLQRAKVATR